MLHKYSQIGQWHKADAPNRGMKKLSWGDLHQTTTGSHEFQDRAAYLCALSYYPVDTIKPEIGLDTRSILLWPGSSSFGFGVIKNRRLWLVFRGSDDVYDWIMNFSWLPFFHLGFRQAWGDLANETLDFVAKRQDEFDEIAITGHSLGGAIAILAGLELARAGHPISAVQTFGAPRVGSPAFARKYDRQTNNLDQNLGDVTKRMASYEEIVSEMPHWVFGFKHVGSFNDRTPIKDGLSPGDIKPSMDINAFCRAVSIFPPVLIPLLIGNITLRASENHPMSIYLDGLKIAHPDPSETVNEIRYQQHLDALEEAKRKNAAGQSYSFSPMLVYKPITVQRENEITSPSFRPGLWVQGFVFVGIQLGVLAALIWLTFQVFN